ncbi:MAG: polysaccharide biosynthesis C-terminal domain-containing protein [Deltaproteobacteria bacterium]|nr:polysaccharide biosynthesis C-terminal domain-containing protein [Deltaproteobacteria bacterium]
MGLRKSAVHLSIINAVSVTLGLVFHILLGREFGISWELDCLFISLLIFSFFGIFNSFITSLLLPVFNEIKTKDEGEGFEFADVVFKWSIGIGLIGWFIIQNSGHLAIKLFASGFDEKAVNLSNDILKILFVGYVFFNLTSSVSVILNSLYYFFIPTFVGLLAPLLNIAAVFILTPEYGVKGIAISYTISNILQSLILLSFLFINTRWRPTLKIYDHKFTKLLKQSSTAVAGVFIWSFRDIISRNIASHLGSGAIALLSYADKIISILSQIVISPISSIFYSRVSELISLSKSDELKNLIMRVMKVNISAAIFASAGVIVFLKPLFDILFLGSRFTSKDIDILFYLLVIEMGFFIIISFETLFVRIVYAIKRTEVVLFIAAAGVALFYVLSKVFSNLLNIYGLALSIFLTQIPVCMLYFYFIKKHITILSKDIFYSIIKNLTLAVPFIAIGLFVNSNTKSDIVILFLWCPIWTSLYWTASRYILKEEWDILKRKGDA